MKLASITRLARSADPKYPTVRHALIGSSLAVVVAVVYDLTVNGDFNLLDPIGVGIAAFLGWAIARELDPDHPLTAVVALAGAAVLAIWSAPLLLLSAVALGALRLLVGSVGGGGPTRLDLVVMVGLAAYAGSIVDGWFVALIIVVGIFVSGGREKVLWAVLAGVAAVVGGVISDTGPDPGDGSGRFIVYLVLLAAVVALAWPVAPRSTTDIGKQPLNGTRLRTARVLAGLALIGAVVASDVSGLTNLGPLTAAAIAAAFSAPVGPRR
jgi:hypothetical protein